MNALIAQYVNPVAKQITPAYSPMGRLLLAVSDLAFEDAKIRRFSQREREMYVREHDYEASANLASVEADYALILHEVKHRLAEIIDAAPVQNASDEQAEQECRRLLSELG
jgi:hypothetical protein